MKKFLAYIISYLFHPALFFLIMPFLVVYSQTGNIFSALKWQIFSASFVFLGTIITFMEILRGSFSDFDITKREERPRLYRIALFLGLTFLLAALYFRGIYFSLSIASIGIAIGAVVFAVVNQYLKVSIHVSIACAFILTISILYGTKFFIATAWIVPVIVWSRVALKKHTLLESLIGGVLGVAITIGTFLIGKLFLYKP